MAEAENLFNSMDDTELVVIGAVDCVPFHVRPDDIASGAMAVDVIDSVLGIIFGDEDNATVPIGAIADRLDYPADREVVIRDLGCGRREPDGDAAGMIVTQP